METRPEFDWTLDPHDWDGYNLTNLEGRLVPADAEELGPVGPRCPLRLEGPC